MNISEVEQTILDIETRSQEAHRGAFQLASNGKFIIKSELEGYEELLKDLEAIKALEQYVQEHKAIIDQYRRLHDRVNAIDTPEFINRNRAETVGNTPDAKESARVENPRVEEKNAGTHVESSIEKEQPTQGENPQKEHAVRTESDQSLSEISVPKVAEPEKEKIVQQEVSKIIDGVQNPYHRGPIEKSADKTVNTSIDAKKDDPKVVTPLQLSTPDFVGSEPTIDPNSYRLRRGEIIQDLPINDLSTQTFKTSGMNSDEIKASQEKINNIPTIDPKSYIDPIQEEIDRVKAQWDQAKGKSTEPAAYKPMSQEEIEAARKKIGGEAPKTSGMTPEEIEAARRKLGESEPVKKDPEPVKGTNDPKEKTSDTGKNPVNPEPLKDDKKKKGKKRKVTKRKKFDWKNNFITQGFNKAYLVIKGLVFSENMNGRTKDYVSICIAMGNYRAAYKARTPEVNNKELEAIDRSITSSTMLTIEEKKRLYKKLTKLARQVERQNHRQQSKAMKESKHLVEELTEDVSMGR